MQTEKTLDVLKVEAEIHKMQIEAGKLLAETGKLHAETSKLNREHYFYPMIATASLIAATVAATKLFLS